MSETPPPPVQPAPGEPAEIATLPAEVRTLVHAVDRMRDRWAEADEAVRLELWQAVHAANDAVWNRLDDEPAGERPDGDAPARGCEAPLAGGTVPPRLLGSSDDGTAVEGRTALRARIAEAISRRLRNATPFPPRVTMTDSAYPNALALADAVLAVRDEEFADARDEAAYCREALNGAERRRQMWRQRAERAEDEIGRLHAAIHVALHNENGKECQHYAR